MSFSRIAIIGVGLLGGSIGLALRASGKRCYITGYGHRAETLIKAQEFGVIDRWSLDAAEAVSRSDLVILCTPVGLFEEMLRKLSPVIGAGTLVTDVGSTKRTVVRLAQEILPEGCHFVGSHPMAGSEKRGVEYARADLFQKATCIVTPTAKSNPAKVAAIERFWKDLGMSVVRLSPEEHDAAVADISHLPHVLAGALVAMQSQSAMPLAGKGFLDTTRIASGDAVMWRDILLDNRDNLKAGLARLQKEIRTITRLLDTSRSEALVQWLNAASERRSQLLKEKLKDIAGE